MRLRLAGVFATWTISLLAASGAIIGAPRPTYHAPGLTHVFASIPGPLPALRLDFGLDPLALPFLALLAMLGFAVGVWCLRRDRPIDAVLIAGFMAAMLAVLVARSAAAFFLAWEAMSLVSVFLVAAHHERRDVRRAALVYLVVAQSGALCILLALSVLVAYNSGDGSFAAMAYANYAAPMLRAPALPPATRTAVFLLALVGFGSKAGLLPLHFWLPRAHPVAPPSASALLSGAMLKVALYGLCLVIFQLAAPGAAWWGVVLITIGTLSAIGGVLYALVEHDLKRLLAYHSVENVGIITIGIGVAVLAESNRYEQLAGLALIAALYHAINHGLFKGLLFLGAGVVAESAGTVDLEKLGGLWRPLRWTAPLFLVGCVAIVGLPPLNGFVSEWLTFQTLINGFRVVQPDERLVLLGAVMGLALTGGLAATCFVKVFGIVFLGQSRRVPERPVARENFDAGTAALGILAALCALFGLAPMLAFDPLDRVVATLGPGFEWPSYFHSLPVLPVTLIALPFAGAIACVVLATRRGVRRVPNWTCGSPVTPAAQYTATAFSKPLRTIFAFVLLPDRRRVVEAGNAWFPKHIVYTTRSRDVIDETSRRFGALALWTARRSRALQSGSLRLYLAYAVVALVVVVMLARR